MFRGSNNVGSFGGNFE